MKKVEKRNWLWYFCAVALLLGGGYITSCGSDDDDVVYVAPTTTDTTEQGLEQELAVGTLTDGPLTTERASKNLTTATAPGAITLSKNGGAAETKASIAAALSAIPQSGSDSYVITLAPGKYSENGLTIKTSNNVTIKGTGSTQYGMDVLIYGQGKDMTQLNTRSTLSFQKSGNIVLQNLTVQNSYGMTTGTAQAEALGVGSSEFTGTLAAYNCAFLSGQDTICTYSKAWFYKCYVEGDVDFLWIESKTGKVALYEECVLRAIGTRTTKAYFTAPRLAPTSHVWKGVVIYNSTLEAESGLKNVYLGRNPWDKDTDIQKGTNYFTNYYENVAIVGSKYYGAALHSAIWSGSGAHGTEDQRYVGFKTDDHFAASTSGVGARIGSDIISTEYNGRKAILNRYYDIDAGKFKEDTDYSWDIDAVISENGWNTTSDSSSSLAEGETKVKSVVYTFSQGTSGVDITSSTNDISGIEVSDGFVWNDTSHGAKFADGGTVSLTLTEPSVITLKACKFNNKCTIATDGVTAKEFKGTDDGESQSILYTGTGGKLVLTFTGTVYLHDNIVVQTLTDEKNGVKSVTISGDTAVATDGKITLTANVVTKYLNDYDYTVTWVSSNNSLATIEKKTDTTAEVTGGAAGTVTITATAGGVEGTYEVTTGMISAVNWVFTNAGLFSGSDPTLTLTGWNQHDNKHAHVASTGTLTFWVVANCTIKVTSYYQSVGTLAASSGNLDKTTFGETGTHNKTIEDTFALTGVSSATKVTLSATGQTYLVSIVVDYGTNVATELTALKTKLAANSVYNFKTITKSDGTAYSAQNDYPASAVATSGTGGGITLSNFKWHGDSYGLCSGGTPATMTIPVTGACKIYVTVSYVSQADGGFSITDGTTPVSYSAQVNNNRDADCWEVTSAGNVTLTATYTKEGTYCISQVSVIYVE